MLGRTMARTMAPPEFSFERLFVGLAITVGGYVAFASERKRKENRRGWLMWLGFFIMMVGVSYGFGVGEFLLSGSLLSMLNNN